LPFDKQTAGLGGLAWPFAGRAAADAGLLMLAARLVTAGCLTATLLVTWPLWQTRDLPPMLPALPLPAVDLGVALLAAMAVVLMAPLHGMAVLTALLAYAVAVDQTRLQPEVVSLLFLLWGTLPIPTARAFARAHLVSMWFFAGLNKLLSPDFIDGTSQWLLSGIMANPPAWLDRNAGYFIACGEMSIGILALLPRTRKLAALAAVALHAGILLDLSPLGHDWNEAVWPWNVALAIAGAALIWTWDGHPLTCVRSCCRSLRPGLIALLVAPAGFYVGVTDAYLAHNLYSSNTARAEVLCAGPCPEARQPSWTWGALNVPLPPEHRLYKGYFRETCRPGDVLMITDTRWWYRRDDRDVQRFACPSQE
jgi:hypothetical protein